MWLSPHVVRLRPAPHCRTPVVSYSLKVTPAEHFINWQQDPYSNRLARLVFPKKTTEFSVEVDLVAELTVTNPFDFFLEKYAEQYPFEYDAILSRELAPYLQTLPAGPKLQQLVRELPKGKIRTVDYLVELNQQIQQRIEYLIRLEPGIQTPEETLTLQSGSCRDSAWLLVQLLRHLGLAARFVSGYLIQLAPDVKSLDGPSGTNRTSPTCTPGPSLSARRRLGGPRSDVRACSLAKGTFRWLVRRIRLPLPRSTAIFPADDESVVDDESGGDEREREQGEGRIRVFDVGHAHSRRSARHQALHR